MDLEHAYTEGDLGGYMVQFVRGTIDVIFTGFSCLTKPRASAFRIIVGGAWSVAHDLKYGTHHVSECLFNLWSSIERASLILRV